MSERAKWRQCSDELSSAVTASGRIPHRLSALCEGPSQRERLFLYGGRWSSPGTRMAYASTTLTLAMAEFLATGASTNSTPTIPAGARIHARRAAGDVDADDRSDRRRASARMGRRPAPATEAALGDKWIATAASGLRRPVGPRSIATPERNVLIKSWPIPTSSVRPCRQRLCCRRHGLAVARWTRRGRSSLPSWLRDQQHADLGGMSSTTSSTSSRACPNSVFSSFAVYHSECGTSSSHESNTAR